MLIVVAILIIGAVVCISGVSMVAALVRHNRQQTQHAQQAEHRFQGEQRQQKIVSEVQFENEVARLRLALLRIKRANRMHDQAWPDNYDPVTEIEDIVRDTLAVSVVGA